MLCLDIIQLFQKKLVKPTELSVPLAAMVALTDFMSLSEGTFPHNHFLLISHNIHG